jgi:hypothetical protein
MKFMQIAVATGNDEEASDRIYALGEDGKIYLLDMDHNREWWWRQLPDIDRDKLYQSRLG